MSTSCTVGFFGGLHHKFEARFDEEPIEKLSTIFDGVKADQAVALEMMRANMRRTYVCDVCVRCGMTINLPAERGGE